MSSQARILLFCVSAAGAVHGLLDAKNRLNLFVCDALDDQTLPRNLVKCAQMASALPKCAVCNIPLVDGAKMLT